MPPNLKSLNSYEMRQELVKPLLMLHALELQDKNDNQIYSAVGFGISFPALEIKSLIV